MFHSQNGLYFEQQADGGVRIVKRDDSNPDAPAVVDEILDKHIWASVIATMSYYGEEDSGFYRAMNFHSGEALDDTTPLINKPRKW